MPFHGSSHLRQEKRLCHIFVVSHPGLGTDVVPKMVKSSFFLLSENQIGSFGVGLRLTNGYLPVFMPSAQL